MESDQRREPRNKGKLVGQKLPLKPKDVSNLMGVPKLNADRPYLAMFNLAIDSKLRAIARKTMLIIYLKFSYS